MSNWNFTNVYVKNKKKIKQKSDNFNYTAAISQ